MCGQRDRSLGRTGWQAGSYQAGNWLFAAPNDGMRLFDRSTGKFYSIHGGWQRPVAPAGASGGTTVDCGSQGRDRRPLSALTQAGIFARELIGRQRWILRSSVISDSRVEWVFETRFRKPLEPQRQLSHNPQALPSGIGS